jgi:hypothetical protein
MRTPQFASCRRWMFTAALVAWSATVARGAITIGAPTNHVHTVAVTGCPPGDSASVTLIPDPVAYAAPAAAGGVFDTTFTADAAQYPGWTLAFGGALNGRLNITDYLARDLGACRGGARLDATYAPAANDPPSLTFSQMFTDNVGGGRVHIDPFPNDDTEPMYYTAAQRGTFGLRFVDNPSDPCPGFPATRTVRFETHVVSFDAATMVMTAYDGWSWGYDLVCIPEPTAAALMAIGVLAMGRRRR